MESKDTGYSPDTWAFDEEVTRVFDDMLDRSIPRYGDMRALCTDIANRFITPNTTVLDLGTSRGGAIKALNPHEHQDVYFIGVDESEPMIEAAREEFKDSPNVHIINADLREGLSFGTAGKVSVAMSVLTLMFIPIEHRQRLVQDVYNRLSPGGAFILIEKVLGATAALDTLFVDVHHKNKASIGGYSQEDIDKKRKALEGVLVPLTAKWNEDILHDAGFTAVDCFYRWCNFAGWVALK